MTEQEWLACGDWRGTLDFVEGKVSDRKLRLFAVACCRDAWPLLTEDGRAAVDVAERYADGVATREELQAARDVFRASDDVAPAEIIGGRRYRIDVGGSTADANALWASKAAVRQSADAVVWHLMRSSGREILAADVGRELGREMGGRLQLFRDIVGRIPFRAVTARPAWLTPDVGPLGRASYENRTLPSGHLENARLAILADALEDAGCTDAPLLDHLRSPGPHVRGCWAVDLLLGKE